MGMCCEKMMMIGWRNAWSMKLRVQDQGEDQRGPGKRLYVRTVKHVSWIKRMPWTIANGERWSKEVRWPGWVWAGECFFWYRPTRFVPDKRPLNGCYCCCLSICLSVPSIDCSSDVACCCWVKMWTADIVRWLPMTCISYWLISVVIQLLCWCHTMWAT